MANVSFSATTNLTVWTSTPLSYCPSCPHQYLDHVENLASYSVLLQMKYSEINQTVPSPIIFTFPMSRTSLLHSISTRASKCTETTRQEVEQEVTHSFLRSIIWVCQKAQSTLKIIRLLVAMNVSNYKHLCVGLAQVTRKIIHRGFSKIPPQFNLSYTTWKALQHIIPEQPLPWPRLISISDTKSLNIFRSFPPIQLELTIQARTRTFGALDLLYLVEYHTLLWRYCWWALIISQILNMIITIFSIWFKVNLILVTRRKTKYWLSLG